MVVIISGVNAMSSKDKLLVITGGSRGIGRAVALKALEDGWRVVISYNSNKRFAENFVVQSNGRAGALPLDVRNESSIQKFFQLTKLQFGNPDALVNSAGIDTSPISIGDLSHNTAMEVFRVNAVGLISCCNEFVATIQNSVDFSSEKEKSRSIVNISSMASTIGGRKGKSLYAASKGAVDVFTVGAAKELAKNNISVFAVRPGVTKTDMTEKMLENAEVATKIKDTIASGEVAEPTDIAVPIVHLISGQFNYASGSILNLSGGGFVI